MTYLEEFGLAIRTIPSETSHLSELKSNYNIGYVVTLNEPWEIVNSTVLNQETMMSLDLGGTVNLRPITDRPLYRAQLNAIAALLERKKNVYFHCNAGRGRSATSVICIDGSEGLDCRKSLQGVIFRPQDFQHAGIIRCISYRHIALRTYARDRH